MPPCFYNRPILVPAFPNQKRRIFTLMTSKKPKCSAFVLQWPIKKQWAPQTVWPCQASFQGPHSASHRQSGELLSGSAQKISMQINGNCFFTFWLTEGFKGKLYFQGNRRNLYLVILNQLCYQRPKVSKITNLLKFFLFLFLVVLSIFRKGIK